MKLMHLSDLHLGKRLGEYSLYEEQKDILDKILNIVDNEKPDCLIIAGDVYNKFVPPEDSIKLFDDFLYSLSSRSIRTFVISGNHDSAERIAFGSRIMRFGGIHLSPVYSGKTEPIIIEDEHGEVNFYLLPFIKPVNVRKFFHDAEISSYNDALKTAVSAMKIDTEKRNVIVTHQFITGASLSESEEIFIGGTENVDAEIFRDFDYVALGHIHSPQKINSRMRYCGTPLKYSKSEINQKKSVTIVELGKKGKIEIRTVPLVPLHDVKEYIGTFDELTNKSFYSTVNTEDFVYITLTDECEIPEAVHKLRKIYPRLIKHSYCNSRTQNVSEILQDYTSSDVTPEELFDNFYREYDPKGMNCRQTEYIENLIKDIWGGEI